MKPQDRKLREIVVDGGRTLRIGDRVMRNPNSYITKEGVDFSQVGEIVGFSSCAVVIVDFDGTEERRQIREIVPEVLPCVKIALSLLEPFTNNN